MVSKAIQSAQTQMEQQNFEIRKNVLKYDEVLNKQRTVIYDERRTVLNGADLSGQIRADDRRRRHAATSRCDHVEATPRSGTWTALDRAQDALPDLAVRRGGDRAGRRGTVRPDPRVPRRGAGRGRAGRLRRARGGARLRGACASWSGGCCCRCWTASGASTSTRWTTCRRASACGRWRSATRSSSTSVRASTCSPR